MILTAHSAIRMADTDDAPFLHQCYRRERFIAAALDKKREPLQPSLDEIRESLTKGDGGAIGFFAVENQAGRVCLMFASRVHMEGRYAEAALFYLDEEHLSGAMADEGLQFMCHRAFTLLGVRKVALHSLMEESALTALLERNGFVCDGVQREVLYGGGRWRDIASWTRHLDAKETGPSWQ